MMIRKLQKKLYYSLGQVLGMTGLTESLLKRWEKEFPELKPLRNRAGNRHYTEKDLNLIFLIKEFLEEKKLAPDEIRARLRTHRFQLAENETVGLKRTLAEIKLEVQEILELIGE
ncbi:MAG: MerR family transcriptional regulator [Calditrichaceae bacterium]|nr:MerR family transcriptional regulator [Calditrichaceae bacterium]